MAGEMCVCVFACLCLRVFRFLGALCPGAEGWEVGVEGSAQQGDYPAAEEQRG